MVSKKTAYIVSLKFAPGLKKEFFALGENIRSNTMDLKYIIAEKYSNIEGVYNGIEYISTADNISGLVMDTLKFINSKKFMKIFSSSHPDFVLFYNPHPLNPFIARLIKRNFPEAITALYLHDPYKPDKSSYGFKKGIYIKLVEVIQKLTVRYMDYVVSPSEYSSYLYKKYYPEFNGKNYIAPLLIPDKWVNVNTERRFFSIIGGAHPATGHDTFIEIVNYAAEKDVDYEFALISSSNISKYIKNLTEKGRQKIKIVNKDIITDSEINEVIRESYAVFRLDKEVTQSGVIPVAYMNKTPIITRDIQGLTQHVNHTKNGYVIPFKCLPADALRAMEYVKTNFIELSMNARRSYEEVWAEWQFDKYYYWLVDILRSK